MSRASQQKRKTKSKERATQRARDRQQRAEEPGCTDFSAEAIRRGSAAERERQQIHTTWIAVMNRLLPIETAAVRLAQFDTDLVAKINEHYLLRDLGGLYAAGWQPTELIRQVRASAGANAATLCRWLVVAEHQRRRGERIAAQWQEQIDGLETPAGIAGEGWLTLLASRESIAAVDLAETVFRVSDVFTSLPRVEVLLAPPSGIKPWSSVVGHQTRADPALNQVRGLLAKAESTEHEAEAIAFTAKAQELMTKHAIDLAMLAESQRDHSLPSVIRLPIEMPYADAKALLLQTVAQHSRCRAVHDSQLRLTTVIGFPADLDATDLMFTSLLVQAQHALAEAAAGAPTRTRVRSPSFRSAFLVGFNDRISARLAEVNEMAYDADDGAAYLPVLRARDSRLDDFVSERYGDLVSSRVRGGFDSLGFARGQLAGEAAAFTAGTLGGAGAEGFVDSQA